MNYKEIEEKAKKTIGPYCKVCPVCNGRACKNQMPGPGAKGIGDTAIRNYDKWKELRLNMDTICENKPVDTTLKLFGKTFRLPVFAGPIGGINLHYGDLYNDSTYDEELVAGCSDFGCAAFTGDGVNPEIMKSACASIKNNNGYGIPTIKPWDLATINEKMKIVNDSNAFAVSMDVDAAGLPFLKNLNPPAGAKTVDELKEIVKSCNGVPFIVKGIMTVKGALKAREAGAKAIIVSNHGGRVLDQCPSTAEVLPRIKEAIGNDMVIIVDGGIRDGADILKALALGADAVIIARPFVTAVFGGGRDGVKCLLEKYESELKDTMAMCGVHSLKEITRDIIFN